MRLAKHLYEFKSMLKLYAHFYLYEYNKQGFVDLNLIDYKLVKTNLKMN